jgi:glycine cleavage system regulatory protein
MKSILISVLGDDKPGLLDSLSEIIVSNDGDWIESNMSTVEAKFAGILRVNVPSKNAKKLIKELTSSKLGLQIACEETVPVTHSDYKSYNIELIGQNHVGIINKLSHVLTYELKANVEGIKTEIIDASMSGEQLFKAQINLHLPKSVDERLIKDKLELIADEMMVEIYSYES